MSDYKFKGQLSTLADMYLNAGDHEPLLEIERVYTQAAKADEYEAKAKAFDNLVDVAYWHFERIHPDYDNGLQYESFYKDIRDEFRKYESGDYS